MGQWPHVEAEITFLSPAEGGRETPPVLIFSTGIYRPHIVMGDPNQRKAITSGREIKETYLGIVFVSGPDQVYFGKQLVAEFVLMYYPQPEHESVVPGATFTIREGPNIVGYGQVRRVFSAKQP